MTCHGRHGPVTLTLDVDVVVLTGMPTQDPAMLRDVFLRHWPLTRIVQTDGVDGNSVVRFEAGSAATAGHLFDSLQCFLDELLRKHGGNKHTMDFGR